MKTACRKSWPGDLFQVLNLTFDPCFNVKKMRSSHKKVLISPLLLVLWLQIVKTDHEKHRLWLTDRECLPYMCLFLHQSVRLFVRF